MNLQKKQNRLSKEKSPYLLQHQYNPVDWYPWGEEAFEKARRENKPIFLSIGYATCHWCHVMEHESFENENTAAILNENFVSIKLDREERPDVDEIYMSVLTQVMGQGGGWPMSMWLTPDLKPFYGGTYFPPDSRYGRPGFGSILIQLSEIWKNRPDDIRSSSDEIVEHLKKMSTARYPKSEAPLEQKIIDNAFEKLKSNFDSECGGFGHAPKFPQVSYLMFLLRYYYRTQQEDALLMVEKQLQAMANGGIYDHLGGGFARYSTDEYWLIPHFEKMLYDNAQLIRIYSEAYQITKKEFYKIIAKETADFVLREMTDALGGFYSAYDADSEGMEGKFYIWKKSEIQNLLKQESEAFCTEYDVTESGNWNDPHHDMSTFNVLNRIRTATDENSSVSAFHKFKTARDQLLLERSKRIKPLLDHKVLLSWNAMMISALSFAGRALNEVKYIEAAKKSADFCIKNFKQKTKWLRRYCDGEVAIEAVLEDYSYFVSALLDLYDATFESKYLELAIELNSYVIDKFYDLTNGGFFQVEAGKSDLLTRTKDIDDGAMPSANNIALLNCIKIEQITGDKNLHSIIEKTIDSYQPFAEKHPMAVPLLLCAVDQKIGSSQQVVFAGDQSQFMEVLNKKYLPNAVFLNSDFKKSPLTVSKDKVNQKSTVYVCENFVCKRPLTEATELNQLFLSTKTSN